MLPTRNGAFRLFRFAGIDVYLHWLWFLVAAYEIGHRAGNYSSVTWNLLEYLGLFAIVTMHEFGHSLACRSVGGRANQIVLWPLGGVAYVDPPARPGATCPHCAAQFEQTRCLDCGALNSIRAWAPATVLSPPLL